MPLTTSRSPHPERLLDRSVAAGNLDRLTALVMQRLMLRGDAPLTVQWGDVATIPDRQALELHFRIHTPRPATLGIHAVMFPYDRLHQTFVNVYEDEQLRQQFVLSVIIPIALTTRARRRVRSRSSRRSCPPASITS